MVDWKSEDVRAGTMFLAVGLFFGVNTLLQLDIGDPSDMGPGFFPLALCMILAALGLGILARAESDEQELPPVNWRAVLLVCAAPVVFALTVRSIGLLPALLISLALAVLARPTLGVARSVLVVLGITAFCVTVFKFGLGVPYELINPKIFALWTAGG